MNDSSTDDIFGSSSTIGIVELDAKLSHVLLSGRHGVDGLDIATLLKQTLHFIDDGASRNGFCRMTSIVVDADNDLTFELTDLKAVNALVGGDTARGQWQDASVRRQGGGDIPSSLGVTNIREGKSEETTMDNLRSIDGSDGRERLGLIDLVSGYMV